MAHQAQKDFLLSVKERFPNRFNDCSVLDIGSLDINGNNRYLFENYEYVGVDIGPGPNVDVICKGHEFKSDTQFDIVVSTECFEHDIFYKETILNAINLTKSNGLFLFTCASKGRAEHGTNRSGDPSASPYSHVEWNDYYKNLEESDIREFLNVEEVFSEFSFGYNPESFDLYFFGIKK